MRVVIAGGHGQIALVLQQLLADAGHEPVGIIRNPAQAADLEEVGSRALVRDLERIDAATLAGDLDGVDAVVFSAGGGPKSGAARKLTMDRTVDAVGGCGGGCQRPALPDGLGPGHRRRRPRLRRGVPDLPPSQE